MHLETLGYAPGNTNGELTPQTATAISEFQSTAGFAVTGQPSPALLEATNAAVDAL